MNLRNCFIYPAFLLLLFLQNTCFNKVLAQEQTNIKNYPDTTTLFRLINQSASYTYSDPDSAIYFGRQSLQLSIRMNRPIEAAKSFGNLGLANVNKGNYAEGLANYHRAIDFFRTKPHKEKIVAQVLNNIASIYIYRCLYDTAAMYAYQALDLLRKNIAADDPGYINIYLNLGIIWVRLGQNDFALQHLQEGLRIAEVNHNDMSVCTLLAHMGVVYIEKDMLAKAQQYLLRSLKLARALGNTSMEQNIHLNMGSIYLKQKTPLKAISHLDEVTHAQELNPMYTADAAYNLGEAYYQMGQYKKAETIILPVLSYADSIGLNQGSTDAHHTLSQVYEAMGRYKDALREEKTYISLRDTQQSKERMQVINLMEVKARTAQKDKDLATKELMIAKQNQKLREQKFMMIGISAGVLLLSILSIVLYRNNRHRQRIHRQRILTLHQEQEIGQLKAQMKGEEMERARIARELHDGVTSQLTAVKFILTNFSKRKEETVDASELYTVTNELDDAIKELRKTAQNLLPDILLQSGLESAVFAFCEKIKKTATLQIDFQVYGELPRLRQEQELSVYRIIQELIQNTLKHAQATSMIVQLSYRNGLLGVTVEDNGKGYNTTQYKNGTGLHNIEERVRTLNGHIDISSKEGTGTTIYFEFDMHTFLK